MNDRIDPNLLAAFFENRLTAEERRRVIDRINASADDYEAFAEVAALLGELRDDAPPAPAAQPASTPLPAQRASGFRWPWMLLPLAAAAAVLMIMLPSLRGGSDVRALLALADASALVDRTGDGALAGAMGADWYATGWNVTRGSSGAADAAAEFRIGARLADLELAFDRRDDAAVRMAAAELSALLDGVAGGAIVARQYAAVQDAGDTAAAASARTSLQSLLGEAAPLRLGVWTEQARLALLAGATDYFDDAAMAALRDVGRELPQHAAELDSVERAAAADDPAALHTAIDALIRKAAD